jgi:hypothetical protein
VVRAYPIPRKLFKETINGNPAVIGPSVDIPAGDEENDSGEKLCARE